MRLEVTPYVQQVLQCFQCLRYGHTAKACKSKPRCKYCGKYCESTTAPNHDPQTCEFKVNPSCLYCLGDHEACNRLCPEYLRQKDIRLRMAFDNESFGEANKQCPVNYKSNNYSKRTYAQVSLQLIPIKIFMIVVHSQSHPPPLISSRHSLTDITPCLMRGRRIPLMMN